MAKKKIENIAEEKIVYIEGIRYEPGYKNMLMSEKLSRNKDTGELVSIGPGSGLPLKKNERISEGAFVEIVRYVELSIDKDLLNKLAYIAKSKLNADKDKNRVLAKKLEAMSEAEKIYEDAIALAEFNYKNSIGSIDFHFEPLIGEIEYNIETLNIFSDSILSRYEDQEKVKVKKIKND